MKRSLFLSFSTLGCPDFSWEEAVSLAKNYGFSGIELRCLNGGLDLVNQLQKTFHNPATMKRVVDDSGVKVSSLDASLRLLEATEESWQEIIDMAAWADALELPYLRVFDGGEYGGGLKPEVRSKLLEALAKWQALREKKGILCDIMIETHWALTSAEACLRLGEEASANDQPLNLLWDTCHTWNHSGLKLDEGWNLLKPWVRHIHVKDSISKEGKVQHTLPGEGEVLVAPLLDLLERDGFKGPISLEWELMWDKSLPPLVQALDSAKNHGWW
ncbi:MAG: sugar phosphate isomerase/epimerase family protein [Chthoniobacterales bacterium]